MVVCEATTHEGSCLSLPEGPVYYGLISVPRPSASLWHILITLCPPFLPFHCCFFTSFLGFGYYIWWEEQMSPFHSLGWLQTSIKFNWVLAPQKHTDFPRVRWASCLTFDAKPDSPVFYSLELACAFVSYSLGCGQTVTPRQFQASNKFIFVTYLKSKHWRKFYLI